MTVGWLYKLLWTEKKTQIHSRFCTRCCTAWDIKTVQMYFRNVYYIRCIIFYVNQYSYNQCASEMCMSCWTASCYYYIKSRYFNCYLIVFTKKEKKYIYSIVWVNNKFPLSLISAVALQHLAGVMLGHDYVSAVFNSARVIVESSQPPKWATLSPRFQSARGLNFAAADPIYIIIT